jgi:hypothetical protein
MQLNKSTFWEHDISTIDPEAHYKAIISRIAMRGDEFEIRGMRRFYGDEKIKEVLLQVRYLDKYTLSLFSNIYNIPKEKFRCYIWKQSNPTHWDL